MAEADRARILRRATNTAPELIEVLVRLETAQWGLRAAAEAAAEVPHRPALAERIDEIEDMVENLIEGLR